MTDSERLAEIRARNYTTTEEMFLLRLLDTTRSERDALRETLRQHNAVWSRPTEELMDDHAKARRTERAESERDATLARVGEYLDAHAALGRLYDTTEECKAAIEREERAFNALRAALTPPAYPPEQPL